MPDLAYVDRSLDDEGPFGGTALCMVDIVFAPLLTRMLVLEPVLSCFPQDRPKPVVWPRRSPLSPRSIGPSAAT